MHMKPRRYRLLCCLLLVALLLPGTAMASGLVDTQQKASLTITYPLAGVEFELYRVASISKNGTFTLTEDFENSKVSLDQPDQAGWQAAADTLAVYTARKQLTPLDSGETGRDKTLTFSNLRPGLYLVVGQSVTSGGSIYTPEPFLVSLPGLNMDGDWEYDVTADPKYEKTLEKDDSDTVNRKVLKVWEDDGYEKQRPKKIQVELLRDGKVWDTVTLSEDNNWRYTWKDLDSRYTWKVVEKTVPDGYTVTVRKEGITFVVTNTYEEPPDEPDIPDKPDVPDQPDIPDAPEPEEPDIPDVPDVPDTPDVPDKPDVSDKPNVPDTPEAPDPSPKPGLPQTGMLWWPVPLLACCGMGLFLIGWARRRSEEDDAE